MGDVAHILGVPNTQTASANNSGVPPPAPAPPSRALQIQSLPREVADLIGTGVDGELPTTVPASGFIASKKPKASIVKVGSKCISSDKPARKWVWAPFSSSSRTDGLLLNHWVRANVEYPDYPYARFDIHLDPVTYSNDDEYRDHLQDPDWSKSETDQLLEMARRYELRWAVIYDRWTERFGYDLSSEMKTPRNRKIEDLQYRYYHVAAKLMQSRITSEAAAEAQALVTQTNAAAAAAASSVEPASDEQQRKAVDSLLVETAAARALASSDPAHQPAMHSLGSGSSNKNAFDLNYERERRAHMEALWNRTKEEELEEAELRKELKQVEAQLRKSKKTGTHILAAGGGGGGGAVSAPSSANPSRAATPVFGGGDTAAVPGLLDQAFASTAPTPAPGNPYLQSARMASPAVGGSVGINKSMKARMDELMEELNVSEPQVATKRACDLYDCVRKDILTLLVLQKTILQKEGLLANKRMQLSKKGGNAKGMTEEALLGISPPPAPAPASSGARSTSKGGRSNKSSSKSGSSKSKNSKTGDAAAKKEASSTAGLGGKQASAGASSGKTTKKSSTSTKRKRKSDATKSPVPAPASGAAPVAKVTTTVSNPAVSSQGAPKSDAAAAPTKQGVNLTKPTGKKRAKKTT